jgi:hypothetical protein
MMNETEGVAGALFTGRCRMSERAISAHGYPRYV